MLRHVSIKINTMIVMINHIKIFDFSDYGFFL